MQGSVEQKRESILGITIEFGGGASITIFFFAHYNFFSFCQLYCIEKGKCY